jgi:nucleoside-diphosphate-sugar epimerase
MLKVAATDEAYGKVFNVGTGIPVSFFELAEKIVAIAGMGRTKFTEFTQERKEVEPGDYYADITRIATTTGWQPVTSLDEGISRTIDFYRKHRKEYW